MAETIARPGEIYAAIETGDPAQVERTLERRPELVHAPDPRLFLRRLSPIERAAMQGDWDLVEPFLRRGANPFDRWPHNVISPCAFTVARDEGHLDLAARLEAWTLAAWAEGRWGQAPDSLPLHRAVYHGSRPLAEALLKAGMPADSEDDKGQRPIHLALYKGAGGSYRRPRQRIPDLRMAELLVAHGAEVDLWVACGLGDPAGIARILEQDPEALHREFGKERGCRSPLALAVYAGCEDVAYGLLRRGCRTGLGDALGWAVGRRRERLGLALLDAGAELDPSAYDGPDPVHTPRLYARALALPGFPPLNHRFRHRNYAELRGALHASADVPATALEIIGMSAWHGRPEAMAIGLEALSVRGIPITAEQGLGWIHSLMRTHNRYGSFEDFRRCLHLLLQAGTRVDAEAGESREWGQPEIGTPLQGLPEAVYLTRPAGSDHDSTEWDDQDDGAKRVEWARLLLAHGARLDLRDAQGRTPLQAAAACGDQDLVALYCDWEPGPTRADAETSRDRARDQGLDQVARYLESWLDSGPGRAALGRGTGALPASAAP